MQGIEEREMAAGSTCSFHKRAFCFHLNTNTQCMCVYTLSPPKTLTKYLIFELTVTPDDEKREVS